MSIESRTLHEVLNIHSKNAAIERSGNSITKIYCKQLRFLDRGHDQNIIIC
jgi:hypothetical protein